MMRRWISSGFFLKYTATFSYLYYHQITLWSKARFINTLAFLPSPVKITPGSRSSFTGIDIVAVGNGSEYIVASIYSTVVYIKV